MINAFCKGAVVQGGGGGDINLTTWSVSAVWEIECAQIGIVVVTEPNLDLLGCEN